MIAVDRLGSGVRISASSEIFALTAGGMFATNDDYRTLLTATENSVNNNFAMICALARSMCKFKLSTPKRR